VEREEQDAGTGEKFTVSETLFLPESSRGAKGLE